MKQLIIGYAIAGVLVGLVIFIGLLFLQDNKVLGAIDPGVTPENVQETICKEYKREAPENGSYLIPVAIGGAKDKANIIYESDEAKLLRDKMGFLLWRFVCSGAPLREAQGFAVAETF